MKFFPPSLFGIVEENLYRSAPITPMNFEFIQTLNLKSMLILSKNVLNHEMEHFMLENDINKIIIEPRDDGNDQTPTSATTSSTMAPSEHDTQGAGGSRRSSNYVDTKAQEDGHVERALTHPNPDESGETQSQTTSNMSNSNQDTSAHVEIEDRNKNSRNKIINRHRSMLFSDEIVSEAVAVLMDVTNYPILITCPTGKYLTGVIVACLRRVQKWSLLSIYEEYRRFAGVKLQLQQPIEEFIEIFDIDVFSNIVVKNNRKRIDDQRGSNEDLNLIEHEMLLTPTKFSRGGYYSGSPPPNAKNSQPNSGYMNHLNDKLLQMPEFVKNCYSQSLDMA